MNLGNLSFGLFQIPLMNISQKMIPAIMGIEIEVVSITGQWKLSQNQPELSQRGVAEALS
jgi:predicted FMN-binding regulatory protein PaiB